MKRRRRTGTDRMLYLDQPIPVTIYGHQGIALVVDRSRIFARWMNNGTVHLQWGEQPHDPAVSHDDR